MLKYISKYTKIANIYIYIYINVFQNIYVLLINCGQSSDAKVSKCCLKCSSTKCFYQAPLFMFSQ